MHDLLVAAQQAAPTDNRLQAAIIAAVVALVVASINLVAQRSSLRQQKEHLERQLTQQGVLLERELSESRRQYQRTSWHESSNRLISTNAAERAVGIATAIDYLNDAQLGTPALRVTLSALHYERDPLVIHRALQALSDPGLLKKAVVEMLVLNRQLWRDLLEEFARTSLDLEAPEHRDLKAHLGLLSNNQKLVSHLLQQDDFQSVDFSNTFLPDLRAPARTFTDCDFSSSLLHYSNFHDAVFEGCDFTNCVLIGAYLEDACFNGCTFQDVVAVASRLHDTGRGECRLPDELVVSSSSRSPSYMLESEQGWRGQWFEQRRPRVRPLARRRFSARWSHTSGGSAHARIVMKRHGSFVRRHDSDHNNGRYKTTSREVLDRARGVSLVGGTRTLASGVPSVWWAVWWQQRHARPSQAIPVSDAIEGQPGR
jgi:Pentapeptide repeats (8 copies)